MLILTIILMDILTGMEFDLFVPGFAQMKEHFHLSPFLVEMSLSINFIGYCISLFIVGELADRFGRKPIILSGLFIFIAGCVLCLATTHYDIFLVGRFLQGLGIGAPAILSFLVISDVYSVKKQQYLLAMLNASLNTAAAFAPVIGSFVTKYFDWQGNFWILLFLSVVIFMMTVRYIANNQSSTNKQGIIENYLKIFKSKNLVLLMIYFMLMFVPYWIFVGISPLLYLRDLGVNLNHFGYYQGSLALTFAMGSLLFGYIVHRYNHKMLLVTANAIFIISLFTILMVTVSSPTNPLLITLAFIPFVIGQIIPSNILYPLYLSLLPEAKGRLTALIQGGRLILASIGLQIAGYFYNGSFHNIGIVVSIFVFMAICVMFMVMGRWSVINEINNV